MLDLGRACRSAFAEALERSLDPVVKDTLKEFVLRVEGALQGENLMRAVLSGPMGTRRFR